MQAQLGSTFLKNNEVASFFLLLLRVPDPAVNCTDERLLSSDSFDLLNVMDGNIQTAIWLLPSIGDWFLGCGKRTGF